MKATLLAHMGDDLMVVNAARVSMGKRKETFSEADAKLINHLAQNKPMHFSPFTHPQLQFHIVAPLFVLRQLYRHQIGLTISEESRRYVDFAPTFYEIEQWRERPVKSIKQGSGPDVGDLENLKMQNDVTIFNKYALNLYNDFIKRGVAPEIARTVLPQSMETQLYWTGSLLAFARVCWHRCDPHAQKEIQDLAWQFSDQIEPLFPVSWAALMNSNGIDLPRGEAGSGQKLEDIIDSIMK